MKHVPRLLSTLLLPLLCACAADHARHAHDAASDPGAPSMTGKVSETEFKAMHELRSDAPPLLHGTAIQINGHAAYLSLPAGRATPLPAVLVIHEWWGLNDNVKHWCDRIAAEGYAAVAVDLYQGTIATTPEEAMAAMKAVDPARALATMQSAQHFLREDERIAADRTAVIGWCFGGGQALRLALAVPELSAAVMYYGQPVTAVPELQTLRAPLLAIFGSRDRSIPPATVAEFDRALSEAGKQHTIISYDADHAFANPSNPHYDQKNAALAWSKVREFLALHLEDHARP